MLPSTLGGINVWISTVQTNQKNCWLNVGPIQQESTISNQFCPRFNYGFFILQQTKASSKEKIKVFSWNNFSPAPLHSGAIFAAKCMNGFISPLFLPRYPNQPESYGRPQSLVVSDSIETGTSWTQPLIFACSSKSRTKAWIKKQGAFYASLRFR